MNKQHYALLMVFFFLFSIEYASALTLYSQQSGTWGLGGTGNLFNTVRDGTGTYYDGNTLAWEDPFNEIIIQSGHTIVFRWATHLLGSLIIEPDAKLYTNDTSSPTNYIIWSFGDGFTVDGELGNGIPADPAQADRIAITVCAPLIKGTGTITVRDLNWQACNPLEIGATINVHTYDAGAWNTWYPYRGQGVGAVQDITVANGGELNVYGSFAADYDLRFAPAVATNQSDYASKLIIDGKFKVYQGNLILKTDNSSGQNFNLIVNGTGETYFEEFIFCNGGSGDPLAYTGQASSSLEISGLLETTATDPIQYSSANSFVSMSTGSNFKLNGDANQQLDDDVFGRRYYDVELAGTGPKVLEGDVAINNELNFTDTGIQLGSFNLTMLKTFVASATNDVFQNSSSTKFIETNGSGSVKAYVPLGSFFGPSSITWPVGNGTYNELSFQVFSNTATTGDFYSVNVANQVLSNGTTGTALTSAVVQKTWNIKEDTPAGESINITFMWAPTDESPDFNTNNTWVSHYNGTIWDTDLQGNGAAGLNGGFKTRRRNGINDFSPFTIFSNATALPVELSYFNGKKVQEGVQLDWQTASELDNKEFIIERSFDGRSFEPIGSVVGNGTTSIPQGYHFVDYHPMTGPNYYRLAQVDFSGTMEYSKIIALEITPNTKRIHIFPSLVNDQLHFQLDAPAVTSSEIEVWNAQGQKVLQKSIQVGSLKSLVDVTQLSPGKYWLRFKSEHQISDAISFIKY